MIKATKEVISRAFNCEFSYGLIFRVINIKIRRTINRIRA